MAVSGNMARPMQIRKSVLLGSATTVNFFSNGFSSNGTAYIEKHKLPQIPARGTGIRIRSIISKAAGTIVPRIARTVKPWEAFQSGLVFPTAAKAVVGIGVSGKTNVMPVHAKGDNTVVEVQKPGKNGFFEASRTVLVEKWPA